MMIDRRISDNRTERSSIRVVQGLILVKHLDEGEKLQSKCNMIGRLCVDAVVSHAHRCGLE